MLRCELLQLNENKDVDAISKNKYCFKLLKEGKHESAGCCFVLSADTVRWGPHMKQNHVSNLLCCAGVCAWLMLALRGNVSHTHCAKQISSTKV